MPEPDQSSGKSRGVLFGGVFSRGGVDAGDLAWLRALLDTEAALARGVERAGLAPAGAGAAVTAAAVPENFDVAELGELAALTGNPVPALSRALTRLVPRPAASAAASSSTRSRLVCHGSGGAGRFSSSASRAATRGPRSPSAASVPAAPPNCTASRSAATRAKPARASRTGRTDRKEWPDHARA